MGVPSIPATILSTLSSISFCPIASLLRRPVRMAASFNRLAKSAPLKPGVRKAMVSTPTPSSNFLLRACTARISLRPLTSGTSTVTCLSKRPGLSSALSKMSTLFVAATTMIPVFPSKPSISVSSWFKVCSLSSLPPPTPAPRDLPTASISSMKTIQGAFSFAFLNKSRTRDAPTPTNISTNSEPLMLKKGTPASPAMALANKVFPVPGGPTRSTPFGILAPTAVKRSGRLRNSTTSMKSCLASSTPATSENVIPVLGSIWNLALDFPKDSGLPGPPGPPMPPWFLRERRNRPPTKSKGKARFPRRLRKTAPPSSCWVCAAKSTFLLRNFCSSSADVPGSCTRTLCTRFPSSGLTASTMAMVPFSYRSTFFTRPMSRYSRNLEYDMRDEATCSSAACAVPTRPVHVVAAAKAAPFNICLRSCATTASSCFFCACARTGRTVRVRIPLRLPCRRAAPCFRHACTMAEGLLDAFARCLADRRWRSTT
mmetsp:Transcript_8361/g.52149  ORF Transcript_8361/g.52149 Transcript_8361/m.52149 type:complete len:485 (+) Transcript_8361:2340-3794(+)